VVFGRPLLTGSEKLVEKIRPNK